MKTRSAVCFEKMPGHTTKYNLMEPSKLILLPQMRPLNPANFVRELSKKGNISNVKRKRVERERERERMRMREKENANMSMRTFVAQVEKLR